MFLRAVIELKGPICTCDAQQLEWSVYRDAENRSSLSVSCEGCGTVLRVPHEKFRATFNLKEPYPNDRPKPKPEPAPPKPKLEALDGGKVLSFSEGKIEDPPATS